MQKSEPTRKTGYGRGAVVTGVLATVLFFLFNLDQALREGTPVMAKIAAADGNKKAGRAGSVPLARDPAIAVAEEYQMARQQGTAQALELFIARHGDDPLAVKARAELLHVSR